MSFVAYYHLSEKVLLAAGQLTQDHIKRVRKIIMLVVGLITLIMGGLYAYYLYDTHIDTATINILHGPGLDSLTAFLTVMTLLIKLL